MSWLIVFAHFSKTGGSAVLRMDLYGSRVKVVGMTL